MKIKKNAGFTLIELMIVVIIVAILAAIALPSYQEHVRKTRRTQAKADLMELAQVLERRYTTDRTYAGFSLPDGFDQSPHTGTAYYEVKINNATSSAYTLEATPIGPQASDSRCMTLTLNQMGVKTASGSEGRDGCW